jgi:parallel beta-helix repeat protein
MIRLWTWRSLARGNRELIRSSFMPGLTALAVAIILSFSPGPGLIRSADATHITCGQTLDSGDFVLDSDVGPCDDTDGPAALTVNGSVTTPATLDLAGFSVICQDLNGQGGVPKGILLTGSNVTVKNGRVTGCQRGIEVGGTGDHVVRKVTAEGSVDASFVVKSSGNRIKENTAMGGQAEGFTVTAPGNLLSQNTADSNAAAGFSITGRNRVKTNTTSGNGGAGFDLTGGGHIKLFGNTASGNTGPGIALGSSRSKVDGTTATGNGGGGYVVTGDRNWLSVSSASGNTGDGFTLMGRRNKVELSTARGNSGNGIAITITGLLNKLDVNTADTNGLAGITVAGLNNLIKENTAQGSGVVDLEETKSNCDFNHWKNNNFGTKSQDCIK